MTTIRRYRVRGAHEHALGPSDWVEHENLARNADRSKNTPPWSVKGTIHAVIRKFVLRGKRRVIRMRMSYSEVVARDIAVEKGPTFELTIRHLSAGVTRKRSGVTESSVRVRDEIRIILVHDTAIGQFSAGCLCVKKCGGRHR
jgi:hypothetical protein